MNIIRMINGVPVGTPQQVNGTAIPHGYVPIEIEQLRPLQKHAMCMIGGRPVMQAVDMPVSLARYHKKREISTARWDEAKGGFLFESTDGAKYWADSDESARISVKVKADEAVSAGEDWTVGWKFDGQFVTLSKADMLKLYADGSAFIEGRFESEAALLVLIDEAETVDDLRVLVWERINWYPETLL